MKNHHLLLAAGLSASSTFAVPYQTYRTRSTSATNSSIPVPPLNSLAKAAGLTYFGTAIDNPDLENPEYVQYAFGYAPELFGQVTPANGQKWDATEPEQNVFNYTEGDAIIDPALNDSMIARCHNLNWYNQNPAWLTSGNFTNATLISILENHIANIIGHYRGQCYAWDVVNEALNDNGTYRSDLWYDTIGPAFIPIAFRAAAQADPHAKLYYNDYNIEYAGAKASAAQALVQDLQAQGVRIDGVGLQSHFIGNETPSYDAQVANLQAFTALGVEVALTELDVRIPVPATDADQAQQAASYAESVQACVDVAGCVGVTVWDFDDQYSWVPGTFPGFGSADLFAANFTAKPAVASIASVLSAAAATGSAKL
ncbi:MAG: hypothetical protein M1821_007530 [Bathelium mastoideum]|nr:MAG: hypothetical protein M1821_007530 [Bathelium mastoideum]KAI9695033.1 MAG: hypothetical protein M1822_000650 [Bathelium mastoideum]